MSRSTITISKEVHKEVLDHLNNGDRKIGKFAESALKEKIEKEKAEKSKSKK